MIGATGDQLAREEMAQTASLRYPRRRSWRGWKVFSTCSGGWRRRLISTAHSGQKGDFVIY